MHNSAQLETTKPKSYGLVPSLKEKTENCQHVEMKPKKRYKLALAKSFFLKRKGLDIRKPNDIELLLNCYRKYGKDRYRYWYLLYL